MKTLIPLTALAALVATGSLPAQTPAYSKPSGYVTQQLAVGFNLISVTLQKPVIFTGQLSAVNGASLSFSANHNLPAGKMLILEITSGTKLATVQEFNVYSTNSITLPAPITGLAQGDSIAVREAPTLEEIFAENLASGSNSSTSDIVWLPAGGGNYDRYYYRTPLAGAKGWRKLGTTEVNAPNTPVVYFEGLFVEVKSTPKPIVMTGEVKTTATSFVVQNGFNLVGTVYPVGSTLASSGLQTQVATSSNSASSDIIWVPTGPGSFSRYYFRTPLAGAQGWRTLTPTEAAVDATTITLPSSVFIERKGAAKEMKITPPAPYGSL